MPAEILWEDHAFLDSDKFDSKVQAVRFRRPQLIDPAHIVSVFNGLFNRSASKEGGKEMLAAVLGRDFEKISRGIEENIIEPVALTEDHFSCLISLSSWVGWPRSVVIESGGEEETTQEPEPIFPDEKVLSAKKQYVFPLKIQPSSFASTSAIRIVHNVPLADGPLMGSATWIYYTQPYTRIELSLDRAWLWPYKKEQEDKEIQQIAWDIFYLFRSWINEGLLARKLTGLGYDLMPRFDPSWTDYVVERQCQTCGQILASMPYKQREIKIGRASVNVCDCRQRKASCDDRFDPRICRKFKIIGAYPVSPSESEHAKYEAMMQADSAD